MLTTVYSEPGHAHSNEDAAEILSHPDDEELLICVLADGQGGQFGGAAASQTAVRTCLELAAGYSPKKLKQAASWSAILVSADEAVEKNSEAGFTTLIALCTDGHKVWGASSGDSAALLVSGKKNHELTERQRKNPPVGSSAAVPITFSMRCEKDFRLILMSDGVWKFVGIDVIASIAIQSNEQTLIDNLRDQQTKINNGHLPDDFTFICVQKN